MKAVCEVIVCTKGLGLHVEKGGAKVLPSDIIILRGFALNFRLALQQCDKNDVPFNLKTFPCGACGDAALLLAEYLKSKGFNRMYYVSGLKGNQSHAWLEHDGIIIDITADQFEGIIDPAIVTRDYSWHRQFRENNRFLSDINCYDERTRVRLWDVYRRITANLNAAK